MAPRTGTLTREFGTALAVLAIYVLTLLAPLHHAAGLQRDFAQLGYETVGSWSICAPLQDEDSGVPQQVMQAKCPAAGVGKNDLTATLHGPNVLFPSYGPAVAFSAPYSVEVSERIGPLSGRPRAPPVVG